MNIVQYDTPFGGGGGGGDFLTWIALCPHLEGENQALSEDSLQSPPPCTPPLPFPFKE